MNSLLNKDSVFTIRNVVRLLALVGIAFGFCPHFLVSCNGYEIPVSALTSVSGGSTFGASVDSQPVFLVLFILPLTILIVLCVKKLRTRISSIIIIGCSAFDILIWFLYKKAIKDSSGTSMCKVKITKWFILDIVLESILFIIGCLVLVAKIDIDCNILDSIKYQDNGNKYNINELDLGDDKKIDADMFLDSKGINVGNTRTQLGFCTKCGHPVFDGDRYCIYCGKKLKENK